MFNCTSDISAANYRRAVHGIDHFLDLTKNTRNCNFSFITLLLIDQAQSVLTQIKQCVAQCMINGIAVCLSDNYSGISLLSHCGKVTTSIILQRILQRIRLRTEEILSEAQAGFRAGRSTIDQLFTLRRLAETYIEFSKYLYVCYVDFKKAFDSVW